MSRGNTIATLVERCEQLSPGNDVLGLYEAADQLRILAEANGDDHARAIALLYRAMWLSYSDRDDEAFEQFTALLPVFERIGDDARRARTLMNLGRISVLREDYERAEEWLNRSLEIEILIGSERSIKRVVSNVVHLYNRNGNRTELLDFLQQTANALSKRGATAAEAATLETRANIALVYFSNPQMAITSATQALELFSEIGNLAGQADACSQLGGAYWHLGDTGRAIEYGMRGVSYAEQTSDVGLLVRSLTDAAFPYMQLDDYEKVLHLNTRALQACEQARMMYEAGWAEMGVGHALLQLGDPQKALEHDLRAVEILHRRKDVHGLGYAYARATDAYVALGMLEEAYEACQNALANRRSVHTGLEIAESMSDLGRLLYRRGEHAEAVTLLNEALAMAQELQAKAVIFAIHKTLADMYVELGDHERAMHHLLTYVAVRDDVQSTENTRRARGVEYLHQQELLQREQLATEAILNNVLPRSVSERLKAGHVLIADTIPAVSVMFIDIVGFTPLAAQLTAEELVTLLAHIFGHFDAICTSHGLEKIKTIGDSYMAVAGAPDPCDDHALRCVRAAIDMMRDFPLPPHVLPVSKRSHDLAFRIGIHTGSAVAGVIGERRIAYDLWGDAVNMAARMESHGEAGRIHVSHDIVREVQRLVPNTQQHEPSPFTFLERGEMEIKGKGTMQTYFLEALTV